MNNKNHSQQVVSEIVSHGKGGNALHNGAPNQHETPSADTFKLTSRKLTLRYEKNLTSFCPFSFGVCCFAFLLVGMF